MLAKTQRHSGPGDGKIIIDFILQKNNSIEIQNTPGTTSLKKIWLI